MRPVLVNGDHVVIRWIFHFAWRDGSVTHMEELAWQRWEGERIAQETFFYDPAQRVPRRDAREDYCVSSVSRMTPVATAAST